MARPAGFWLNRWTFEDLLLARHLSRTEVAEAAAISLGALSDLTSWRRSASITTVRQLAAAMRCAPETLFPQLAEQQRDAALAAKTAAVA